MNNLNDTSTVTPTNVNNNIDTNNEVNNIYFFLDEKEDSGNKINDNDNNENHNDNDNDDSDNNNINEEIFKMLDDFKFENYNEYEYAYNNDIDIDIDKFTSNEELYCELDYFINKKCYCDDVVYYNTQHNVKELIEICKYYGIDKFMKLSKCKKQDIIIAIITFEMDFDNYIIVQKRHKMWAFMTELKNDPKMKNYLLF